MVIFTIALSNFLFLVSNIFKVPILGWQIKLKRVAKVLKHQIDIIPVLADNLYLNMKINQMRNTASRTRSQSYGFTIFFNLHAADEPCVDTSY